MGELIHESRHIAPAGSLFFRPNIGKICQVCELVPRIPARERTILTSGKSEQGGAGCRRARRSKKMQAYRTTLKCFAILGLGLVSAAVWANTGTVSQLSGTRSEE